MNTDLPLNPFRTPRLHNIFRDLMNGKKCLTHKKRGRFLLWKFRCQKLAKNPNNDRNETKTISFSSMVPLSVDVNSLFIKFAGQTLICIGLGQTFVVSYSYFHLFLSSFTLRIYNEGLFQWILGKRNRAIFKRNRVI